jgi:type VI secretion system protein ImpA
MIFSQDSVSKLLAPLSEESACGPDLEYDPAFNALETLSRGKPESQFGDTVIAAEEPDWNSVAADAIELLGRSKDLRIAILLTRAATHQNGLPGLVFGLNLIYGLMGDHWSQVHPLLDASDRDDPTMRMNALQALNDPNGLLKDVREASLGKSKRSGPLNVRGVEIAWNKLSPREGEAATSSVQVLGALTDIFEGRVDDADCMKNGLARLKDIKSLLNERIASAQIPDFSALQAPLHLLSQVHAEFRQSLGGAENSSSDENQADGDASQSSFSSNSGGATQAGFGVLRNRDDAKRLLDQVAQFILKTEPGNPAPLLIERAKRLIGASFLDIINDLAPDAMNTVKQISGARDDS